VEVQLMSKMSVTTYGLIGAECIRRISKGMSEGGGAVWKEFRVGLDIG
jgi:hypothetical protein